LKRKCRYFACDEKGAILVNFGVGFAVTLSMKQAKSYNKNTNSNMVHESLELYFQSQPFVTSFRRIKLSTPEEQEQANRQFSSSLSGAQRLQYMNYLNRAFLQGYDDAIAKPVERKIYIDAS
jgi:hypothetical protein